VGFSRERCCFSRKAEAKSGKETVVYVVLGCGAIGALLQTTVV
jgi:hypothetical protein